MRKFKPRLYMQVTKDEYELPIVVADSADELGEIVGKSGNSILSLLSRGTAGWARVVLEDEDERERLEPGE